MNVLNFHARNLPASADDVGALIDGLASPSDRLWPSERWPAMKFDGPLNVGARGGHGPIRYFIKAYEPRRSILFQFTAPKGFDGAHGFSHVPSGGEVRLIHTLRMTISGPAYLSWPVVFRPLHDALIEDALDKAERSLGREREPARFSLYVRGLRWLFGRRRGNPGGAGQPTDGRNAAPDS